MRTSASVGEDKTGEDLGLGYCQVVWTNELPGPGQNIAYSSDGDLLGLGFGHLSRCSYGMPGQVRG